MSQDACSFMLLRGDIRKWNMGDCSFTGSVLYALSWVAKNINFPLPSGIAEIWPRVLHLPPTVQVGWADPREG